MKNTSKHIIPLLLILALILTVTPTTAEAKTVKQPARVTIKSVTRSDNNKKITIRFKKVKNASGYQIAYKNEYAKSYKTVNTKKLSKTISVNALADYKVKVRAYRKTKIKGVTKKVYGRWSTVKTIKHKHTWETVYKTVVDQKGYDEQIFTGEYYTKIELHWFGRMDKFDENYNFIFLGYIDIEGWTYQQLRDYEKANNLITHCLDACHQREVEVIDYDNPIYTIVHHDPVTHEEVDYHKCKTCGETK